MYLVQLVGFKQAGRILYQNFKINKRDKMNASQDRRKEEFEKELEAAVTTNEKKMHEEISAGHRYIICEGIVLRGLKLFITRIPKPFKVKQILQEQVMIQPSTLQIPKQKPQMVVFYYPVLERG